MTALSGPAPAPQTRSYQDVYIENGRWYGTYRKGKYMFPVDEMELERLDVFHKIFQVARKDVLHNAPLHNQEPRILDLGCGTGIWGIEMADKYPRGTHVGVDLNYIQPEYIPMNIRFLQQDIEVTWQDLEPNSWDLIHMRTLNGSIANWPKVYAEVYRHLKPYYGYIEQVEIDWNPRCDDGTMPRDAYVVQWANELMDAMDGFGRPLRMDSNLTKQRLTDAGFVDIKEEVIRLALNGWPADSHGREVGRWFNLGLRQSYQPLSLAPLARGHNRTPAEIHELTEKVGAEIYSLSLHAYCTLHIFTARKPR
ncbi:Trans-aconitate 2-methyltransferase [Madurella mycetomatis]|uniref:Trans-aconitate 2-methyltransferase n=1 Tax=Madurella mycetomatis TaxID=100816 RepID=A0A175W9P0_9PEZI|nr:Trans-aconitate 2-methyltransferase [Madurella mycetomatis]